MGFYFFPGIFYLSLGTGSELTWVALLPQISASIYFQWVGAFVCMLFNIGFQGGLPFRLHSPQQVLTLVGIWLTAYLLLGVALAYLSTRYRQGIR